ncbi:MAG: cupredoxin domain-containing protein [Rickettsiales bacterium]|nr:cupredoxin domain-containing protein [Rickettsiales bacterium]
MKKFLFLLTLSLLSGQSFAATAEYNIQIKDHRFIPSTIEVKAEEKFKLIIENLDQTAAEFESHDLNKEKILIGGKKTTLIITPLKAGEYNFCDDFHAKETVGKIIAK